ncbi:ABC transporter substrate-binding protein [Alphaproteobacteria bacterium]|nr:ABC transporter substrate-binding protein [Alphaproteobacteria bacterium]
MRLILTAVIFALCAAPAAALPRVMSLNLCADPYLMAFADKAQIVALTPLSRDARLSANAAAAENFPVSDGQIEAIIELKPDLVIVSSWSDPMRNALIKRLGFELLTLDAAQNYTAARDEIITLGKAIGREAQARAYLQNLDAALAALQKLTHAPKVLPLQRRNLTVGQGHILDDILSRAGAVNLGRDTSDSPMRRVSLESALAVQADYILVNETDEMPDSRGMEFITHPALARAYPATRRLHIDNNLLVCAGASTPRAVAALISQLNQYQKRAASSQ